MLEAEAISNSKTDSRRRVRGDATAKRLCRFLAGMTLQQVSSGTGISVTRLSLWEREQGKLDSKEEAAIASLLSSARREGNADKESLRVHLAAVKEITAEKVKGKEISYFEAVRRVELARDPTSTLDPKSGALAVEAG